MKDLDYIIPENLNEALALYDENAAQRRTRLLAGGTDIACELKEGIDYPEAIIQINHLPELRFIEERDGHLVLGAMTTWRDMELSDLVRERVPLLFDMTREFASIQIRAMATVGGNLATASPAGDSIPPFFALDSIVNVHSTSGERAIPISEFYIDRRRTALTPGELIESVEVPIPDPEERCFFIKMGQRASLNIAKVTVCGQVAFDGDGKINALRVAYGSVTPVIKRGFEVEKFLRGKKPTLQNLTRASEIAMSEVSPITDIRSTDTYRRRMTGVLLKRGIASCVNARG